MKTNLYKNTNNLSFNSLKEARLKKYYDTNSSCDDRSVDSASSFNLIDSTIKLDSITSQLKNMHKTRETSPEYKNINKSDFLCRKLMKFVNSSNNSFNQNHVTENE